MSNVLDSPVWHALVGPQAGVAIGRCRARHFPRDMAPLSAIESPKSARSKEIGRIVTYPTNRYLSNNKRN